MGGTSAILCDSGLTPKQKEFTQVFLETENATEAASRAYDVKNRDVANAIGAENLAKPSIIYAIEEAYRREGLTPDYLKSSARVYVERGKIDSRWAGAGVSALKTAAQIVGILKESSDINVNVVQLSIHSAPAVQVRSDLSHLDSLDPPSALLNAHPQADVAH